MMRIWYLHEFAHPAHAPSHPEVCSQEIPGLGEHNIVGLDIPAHYPLGVDLVESLSNVSEEALDLAAQHLRPAPVDMVEQRLLYRVKTGIENAWSLEKMLMHHYEAPIDCGDNYFIEKSKQ
jgi:hypothetical protein